MSFYYLPPRRSGKTLMSMKKMEWRAERMRRVSEQTWRQVMGSYTADLYSRRGNKEVVGRAMEEVLERLSAEKGRKGAPLLQRKRSKEFHIELNRHAMEQAKTSIRGIHADKIYWFEEEN